MIATCVARLVSMMLLFLYLTYNGISHTNVFFSTQWLFVYQFKIYVDKLF